MMIEINNQIVNINDTRANQNTPLIDLIPILQAFLTQELIDQTVQKHRDKYDQWKSDSYDGSPLDAEWGPASIIAEIDENSWLTVYIDVTDTTATISYFEVNDPPCKVSFGSVLKNKEVK